MVAMQLEATKYVFYGLTGDIPSAGAEIQFLTAGNRPVELDWSALTIIPDSSHALWADSQGAGVSGTYFVAVLVGSFGTGGIELPLGDYQPWIRLTDTIEQDVLIAPQPLEVV